MKAIVYDKWLHSLGGGEVVACNIAKILREKGYKVIFISGKEVPQEVIFEKLKIDLKGIHFKQVWNDEIALKRLVRGSDLFVNISFMDYSIGFAKKNIYYANFPTKPYKDLSGLIITKILVPIISRFTKPIESLSQIDAPVVINKNPAYALRSSNKYALPNLTLNKPQVITFSLYCDNFYHTLIKNIKISLENTKIIERNTEIFHNSNTVQFKIKFIPFSSTVYLNLYLKNLVNYSNIEDGTVYLLYPKIHLKRFANFLDDFLEKFKTRLRAGIFTNVAERLSTYQTVLTYSYFGWKWIKNYWNIDAKVIAPPVDLLYKKYKVNSFKKKNWICSVGRFFTLGHGKKQEVLIEAFKKLTDKSKEKWELHLVGGLGDEPSSIKFFKYLKAQSKGYPIFFHINASRQEVEEIYLRSKIYWHATGFNEDKNHQPIRFEHFGITPIEGLSAKCVPILFNGGGLREIVTTTGLDLNKHLFNDIEELVSRTAYFQSKQNMDVLDWGLIFERIDKHYSLEAFKNNFLRLLS